MANCLKLTFCFFAFFLPFCLHAQEAKPKHELTLGIGPLSYHVVRPDKASLGGGSYSAVTKDASTIGAFQLRYLRHTAGRWFFGGSVVFERTNGTAITQLWGEGSWSRSYISLLPEGGYTYYRRSKLELYASLSAGTTYVSEKINAMYLSSSGSTMLLAWHATPVGLRFGKKAGVYAEAGYGFKGLINAGLSIRF